MGRVNSQSRISTRRKAALVRRQANIKTWAQIGALTGKTEDARKEIERKITIAQTDIENLGKKGIR